MGKGSKSFIVDIPLKSDSGFEKAIHNALKAKSSLRNWLVNTQRRAAKAARENPELPPILRLPKATKEDKKIRNDALNAFFKKTGFTEGQFQVLAQDKRNVCWIGHHLMGADTQKIASDVAKSYVKYILRKGGLPRRKKARDVNSIEGKDNKCVFTYRSGTLRWKKHVVPLLLRNTEWEKEALKNRVKFCRIVRRTIRTHFHIQLIMEGLPPQKITPGDGAGAIDLGPKNLALVVADQFAAKSPLIDDRNFEKNTGLIKALKRRIDRCRRAGNPTNYRPDGTVKRGKRSWTKSKKELRLETEAKELSRRITARSDQLQGELINKLLSYAVDWSLENTSQRSWQHHFGKAVGRYRPGRFIELLCRKAENAGGKVTKIPLRMRLSQYDHISNNHTKKPLSQRVHVLPDGTSLDRDLYSAFLALGFSEELGSIDTSRVKALWPGAEPLLRNPVSTMGLTAQLTRKWSASPTSVPATAGTMDLVDSKPPALPRSRLCRTHGKDRNTGS